ncbi:hypothetical protein D3C76_1516400 [compost metagenome]
MLQGGLDHLLPIAFAGDVVADEQRIAADLRGDFAPGLFIEVGEHHPGALAGQQQGVLAADAAGGAGDDADFAFYTLHGCSPDGAGLGAVRAAMCAAARRPE